MKSIQANIPTLIKINVSRPGICPNRYLVHSDTAKHCEFSFSYYYLQKSHHIFFLIYSQILPEDNSHEVIQLWEKKPTTQKH